MPGFQPLVTWQGFPCMATGGSFSFSRTPGLSADSGVVRVPMREFKNARISADIRRFFSDLIPDEGGTRARGAERSPIAVITDADIPVGKTFGIKGDLIMQLGPKPIVLPDIYLKEDGLEEDVLTEDAGDGPILRIPITDIRYWWGRRGATPFLRANWLNPDGSFREETHNPDTEKPWTLEELINLVLPNLPGKPRLGRLPPGLGELNPKNIDWPGRQPLARNAIEFLMKQFGLLITLDTDPHGFVSFWLPREGRVGQGPDNNRALPAEALIENPRSTSFSFPPEAVDVLGPPTLIEALSEGLRPVAVEEGDIMDLQEWLTANFKLTLQQAGRLALQNPRVADERFSEDEIKRFREHAFREYAIPDKDRPRQLPILDRLKTDEVGRRLIPIVAADGFSERIPAEDGGTDSAEGNEDTKGKTEETQARSEVGADESVVGVKPEQQSELEGINERLKELDNAQRNVGVPTRKRINRLRSNRDRIRKTHSEALRADLRVPANLTRLQNLSIRLASAQGDLDNAEAEAITGARQISRDKATLSRRRDDILAGADQPEDSVRFVNLPVLPVSDGDYSIDRQLGVIRFKEPRGTLTILDVESKEMSQLIPAVVSIIYAFQDKPGRGDKPDTREKARDRHYTFSVVWNNGKPKRVDKLGKNVFPMPVARQDLEKHVFLDGTDNVKTLDAEAQEAAFSLMSTEGEIVGSAPFLATFVPVNCNGVVLGVQWQSDGNVAMTAIQATASKRGPGVRGEHIRRVFGRLQRTVARLPGGISPGVKEKEIMSNLGDGEKLERTEEGTR